MRSGHNDPDVPIRAMAARPRAPRRGARLPGWLVPVLLGVLTLGHCVANDFSWDDARYVSGNPAVHSLRNVPRFFTLSYWNGPHATTVRAYRPLRDVSLAIDYALWGERPAGYHVTSLLMHLVTVWCVYAFVVRVLAGRRAAALLAAAVYAVHPCQVEAVSMLERRGEMLAAWFALASAGCWLRAIDARGARRWGWAGAMAAAFVLAFISKANAVALPLALAAIALSQPRLRALGSAAGDEGDGQGDATGEGNGFVWGSIVALCLLAAGLALANMALLERSPGRPRPIGLLPLRWRPALVLTTLHSYLAMAVLPLHCRTDRPLALPGPPLAAWCVGLAGWALLLAAWALRARRGRGAAGVGWVWLGVFLLPVMNVLPLTGRPLAEHRLYLPLAGLGLWFGVVSRQRRSRRVLAMGAVVAFAALSCQQTPVWLNEYTTWFRNVAASPDSEKAHSRIGWQYAQMGALARGERHLRRAFFMDPFPGASTALRLGLVHMEGGEPGEAAIWFDRAVRIHPDDPEAWALLADAHVMRHDAGAAERAANELIERWPQKGISHECLAWVWVSMGKLDAAEAQLRRAVHLEPARAEAHAKLAHVCAKLGNAAQARASCLRAIELDPGNALARMTLAELGLR